MRTNVYFFKKVPKFKAFVCFWWTINMSEEKRAKLKTHNIAMDPILGGANNINLGGVIPLLPLASIQKKYSKDKNLANFLILSALHLVSCRQTKEGFLDWHKVLRRCFVEVLPQPRQFQLRKLMATLGVVLVQPPQNKHES